MFIDFCCCCFKWKKKKKIKQRNSSNRFCFLDHFLFSECPLLYTWNYLFFLSLNVETIFFYPLQAIESDTQSFGRSKWNDLLCFSHTHWARHITTKYSKKKSHFFFRLPHNVYFIFHTNNDKSLYGILFGSSLVDRGFSRLLSFSLFIVFYFVIFSAFLACD